MGSTAILILGAFACGVIDFLTSKYGLPSVILAVASFATGSAFTFQLVRGF